MTEQEWTDLLTCIIAARNLSNDRSTIESANRANDWLMGVEFSNG